ncbi:hypothetical protein V3C99_010876, partial [Haemonchus contortus]
MGWTQQIQPFPNQKWFPTKVCVCPDDPRLQESPSEFDHDQNDEALYEDKFCKVTANDIFVKSYYFPCGSSARIPLQSVSSMWIQPEGDRFPLTTTEWGSTCGKIWWALNNKRNSSGSYCNVIVLEPRRPQLIGFSVRKRQRFLNVLESIAHFPINTTIPSDYC